VVVAALAAVLAGTVAPAGAKGPTAVTIQSPGGEPVALPVAAAPDAGPDQRLMWLAEDMGMWDALDPRVALPADPPSDPGAAFPVVWDLVAPSEDGPGEDGALRLDGLRIEQQLHPQAAGGPLVHTDPGQAGHAGPIGGGWYRASPRLARTLESLGWATKTSEVGGAGRAGAPAVLPAEIPANVPGELPRASGDDGGMLPGGRAGVGAAVAALVVVGGVAGGVVVRRRRTAQTAVG
jgi:hypothetical protein